MDEKVLHAGIVQEVSADKLKVVIINASACSSCHAQGSCLASDMSEKEIDIFNFSGDYYPGQQVNVIGRQSQGYKAAFFGYILPVLFVIVTLIVSINLIDNDGLSGILSLAILIPYYTLVYLFRNKLKSTFQFEITANI